MGTEREVFLGGEGGGISRWEGRDWGRRKSAAGLFPPHVFWGLEGARVI